MTTPSDDFYEDDEAADAPPINGHTATFYWDGHGLVPAGSNTCTGVTITLRGLRRLY